MSNYHAIATVTATLHDLLKQGFKTDFRNVIVSSKPLDVLERENISQGLNIFLYQIQPNTGYNNYASPTRDSSGRFIKNPVIGLNLYYLLTAYTNEINDASIAEIQEIRTHQIIAKAIMTLNENPVLGRDQISNMRSSFPIFNTHSSDDNLENQFESIKFTLNPLSLDEMTKIWSSFFQIHYRLSVSYLATVVLLESKVVTKGTHPVLQRNFYSVSNGFPTIYKIDPQFVEFTNNVQIKLVGKNLSGEAQTILFDNKLEPKTVTLSKNYDSSSSEEQKQEQVIVTLPDKIRAGIRQLQIFKQILDETQQPSSISPSPPANTTNSKSIKSNIVAFVLVPKIAIPDSISLINKGGNLAVSLERGVYQDQQVVVCLDNHEFKIDLPPSHPPDIIYPLDILPSIDIPDSIPVTESADPSNPVREPYIIRVKVDGVYSFARFDDSKNSPSFGNYVPGLRIKP